MKLLCSTLIIALAGLAAVTAQETKPASSVAGVSGTDAARDAWTDNYRTALARARGENKDLLLVFTGSDWIKICGAYDRDILFQPDFVNGIADSFVPVRFDFPKETKLPAQQKARNQMMMRAYRVAAFPTLVLTDTQGRPYGINGYQPVTPAEYAKVIQAMKATGEVRDDLFSKAAQASGVEKASLLAKAIPKLPGSLAGRFYRPELEAIIENDPENETGKVPVAQRLLADVDYSDQMEKLKAGVQWSKMIELTDSYIEEQKLQGAALQQALFNKVGVYKDQANTEAMARTLLEIVKIDESTQHAKNAQKILDGMRARVLEEQLSPK